MFEFHIMWAIWQLIFWSLIYSISYTTKIWLILWISIVLSIMADISMYIESKKQPWVSFSITNQIISLLIQGMFLYISYNLYKNPTEAYTYVRVLNNSSKTKPNQ